MASNRSNDRTRGDRVAAEGTTARRTFRAPRVVASLEAQRAVLQVAAAGAHDVDALGANLGPVSVVEMGKRQAGSGRHDKGATEDLRQMMYGLARAGGGCRAVCTHMAAGRPLANARFFWCG